MDWKTIIALAVLVLPIAYCEAAIQKQRSIEKIACFQEGGKWSIISGGTCTFD